LGVSDRAYFGWLTGALDRFERAHGRLAAIGRSRPAVDLWGLAEQRVTPALERIRAALDPGRTRLALFDKFPAGPEVRRLDDLPPASCDVVTLFRASYFIAEPARALAALRRVLRPGGLAIVDWLHGSSDAPVLGFPLDPRCGGEPSPLLSTYMDPTFLAEFPREFRGLIAHVNRPPWGVNVEQPGAALGLRERLRWVAGRGPRRDVTPAGYLDALRADLRAGGRRLVEPALLEQHFAVLFRDARYPYRETGKFNLYLLTVLEPVGATADATPAGPRPAPAVSAGA